ncbi:MAG: hypothetical protein A2700_00010 [Candidatus Blackburnbacteria bacterium RIFCSPHIGHO2_01_FULL_44_64]|nr:MAG: hypothetical protein A2700_00010 [Candidatus Blackburnbacteria bacterium RIFCSPHIGHO2_01_FULL_44_64]OGY11567.1 MAG: hypothetical protein A3E16_04435 [Candidatus Blackburnbacteria bacterium RIFCSPHIGHO2_12_FULL_44_25]OGY13959.1 MAG: hypothetical protein A3A62_01210 [Candidatus Blackburnbacteria bacterium RIFCSPLOWO2_01_FULL_44_43]
MSKTASTQNVLVLYSLLLVVWGFYRVLFKLPENIEEVVIKPVLWLGLLAYFLRKEGVGLRSVGFTSKNLFKSVYLSLGLGVLFVVVAYFSNLAKYEGRVSFSDFGFTGNALVLTFLVSLITAVVEETVFRGYIFGRLAQGLKSDFSANILSSTFWVAIHLPVLVFVYKLSLIDLSLRVVLVAVFGVGSAFLFSRTRNIVSSILLHVLWSWPIILFR